MLFYHCINTDDPAYKKLCNDEEYEDFFTKLKDDFFSLDFFRDFCGDPAYADMIPGYIGDAAVGMYRRWQEKSDDDPKKPSLDELATQVEEILMGGLKGVNRGA